MYKSRLQKSNVKGANQLLKRGRTGQTKKKHKTQNNKSGHKSYNKQNIWRWVESYLNSTATPPLYINNVNEFFLKFTEKKTHTHTRKVNWNRKLNPRHPTYWQ